MNCREAESIGAAHVDGELDALRKHAIHQHLTGCSACAARHRESLALRQRIRAEIPFFVAPPALHARVRAAADAYRAAVPAAARRRVQPWRWLTGGVLAGCAATAFSWMLGTTILAARANDDFAVAAVATHVRASRGERLIEVASSDQHTVKPWLSARLDYSPPVQDLADEGFALLGGRLEYVERNAVATLVYRFGPHTIDVFVRPDMSQGPMPSPQTVRGFNVACARGPTMDWVAVSDVEPAVLAAFVQRLAREEAPGSTATDRE